MAINERVTFYKRQPKETLIHLFELAMIYMVGDVRAHPICEMLKNKAEQRSMPLQMKWGDFGFGPSWEKELPHKGSLSLVTALQLFMTSVLHLYAFSSIYSFNKLKERNIRGEKSTNRRWPRSSEVPKSGKRTQPKNALTPIQDCIFIIIYNQIVHVSGHREEEAKSTS